MLKKVIIGLLIIIGLIVIVSFLLPKTANVERSIEIAAKPEKIFKQLNSFKNNAKWSPWDAKDPNMKKEFSGNEEGVGAIYSWSGNDQVGVGTQEIIESTPNSLIRASLDFKDMGKAVNYFKLEPTENGTKVIWGFDTDTDKPPVMGRYFGLMMDKFVGPDFEKGLENLKAYIESLPNEPEIKISVTEKGAINIYAIKDSCGANEIGAKMGAMYGELMGFLKVNKAEMAGAPLAIYYHYSPEKVVFEAAIPVGKLGKGKGRITAKEIPAGNYVMATHMGSYNQLMITHEAIGKYMDNNNYEQSWVMEEYITDPMMEKDTAKWQTVVYYAM